MSRRLWWLAFGAFVAGFMFAWIVFTWPVAVRGQQPPSAPMTNAGRDPGAPSAEATECTDARSRFVGLYEDRVAVFAGDPDGCRLLLMLQPWTTAELLPFQAEDLQRGIVFSHDSELFQILEGLVVP